MDTVRCYFSMKLFFSKNSGFQMLCSRRAIIEEGELQSDLTAFQNTRWIPTSEMLQRSYVDCTQTVTAVCHQPIII